MDRDLLEAIVRRHADAFKTGDDLREAFRRFAAELMHEIDFALELRRDEYDE